MPLLEEVRDKQDGDDADHDQPGQDQEGTASPGAGLLLLRRARPGSAGASARC